MLGANNPFPLIGNDVLFEFAQMKISNKNLEDQKILMKYVNHFKSRGFNDNVILKVIEKIREDET